MARGVEAVGYWMAKRGNREDEWEDHFTLDEATGRFAVADGASSSAKAAAWAATLTRGFIADPFEAGDPQALDRWLERRCLEFGELHGGELDEDVALDNWMHHGVAEQHGFATFIGVALARLAGDDLVGNWVGVGDACLFHVRDGALAAAAPLTTGDGFGSHPDLVTSDPEHRPLAVAAAFRGEAHLSPGDSLLLVSDALAEWSLGVSPREPRVWDVLTGLDRERFNALVNVLRDRGEMVNDDVTLVRCRVAGS
ncbi:MAG: hypothetical protein GY929_00410 [Actinomycetia bacterium]|nr:hypothetical protein [Actinomycetes bacterium]